TGANPSPFDFAYDAAFETYSVDLQNIVTLDRHALVFGGRYQNGQFDTADRLVSLDQNTLDVGLYAIPAANQNFTVDFERINTYLYDTWEITPWLSLTGGLTYDQLKYPDNFRNPPINNEQRTLERVSPKAGFILQPFHSTVFRGAYAEAISGASFDESVRLEPTQVSGFTQAYRSLASESLIGSVAGSRFRFWGVSLEQ